MTRFLRHPSGIFLPQPKLGWYGPPSGSCSCCSPCVIKKDQFNRDDNDDPGSKWDERSGDWDISDNALITSDTDALCIYDYTRAPPYVLEPTFGGDISLSATHKLAIVFGYVDDNNYWRVEFDGGANLIEKSGGVDTTHLDAGWNIGDLYGGLYICVRSDRVEINGGDPSTHVCVVPEGKIGVATGDALEGNAVFDELELLYHDDEVENCPRCSVVCDQCLDNLAPPTILLTFTGWGNTTDYIFCDEHCDDCSDFNTAVLLDYAGNCNYGPTVISGACGDLTVTASLAADGLHVAIAGDASVVDCARIATAVYTPAGDSPYNCMAGGDYDGQTIGPFAMMTTPWVHGDGAMFFDGGCSPITNYCICCVEKATSGPGVCGPYCADTTITALVEIP